MNVSIPSGGFTVVLPVVEPDVFVDVGEVVVDGVEVVVVSVAGL